MPTKIVFLLLCFLFFSPSCFGQQKPDDLRLFQFQAVELAKADWIHWGDKKSEFDGWSNHSNRLIPVYSYGVSLDTVAGENSCYRNEEQLKELYGKLPVSTYNEKANYFDQTDIYRLQEQAWKSGKKNVILMVFDGMDWNTTQAAAIYKHKKVVYTEGRGNGLTFQDYKKGNSEFGYCVTSPFGTSAKFDVDAQVVNFKPDEYGGGYSWRFAGQTPWEEPGDPSYLIRRRKSIPHPYTDSAASATSLCTGKKTYNAAINVSPDNQQLVTLAHQMQENNFAVGVVTSVPISHATPACAYAHNVSRKDYQDISRDMLGLRSSAHRDDPLLGLDVLIGCGWGELNTDDRENQGENYVPGNQYIADTDIEKLSKAGNYVVRQRTEGRPGIEVLAEGARLAVKEKKRLFGFFGGINGHLPFRTADGDFKPTLGNDKVEAYEPRDLFENPTLAEMAAAALEVLQYNPKGFYLMVECGDVDWGLHNNNIDDAIGAVFSGEEAFTAIVDWVDNNSNWDETCLIVTSDHGHLMFLDDPTVLTGERSPMDSSNFVEQLIEKRSADSITKRLKDLKSKQSKLEELRNPKPKKK